MSTRLVRLELLIQLYFSQILLSENMKRLIIGDGASASTEFQVTVFRSFLETLVQSLYDLTLDIREYVRLGRALCI